MNIGFRHAINVLGPLYDKYKELTLHNRRVRIHPQNAQTHSIFVHIPKTGGFSVAMGLYGLDPWHFSLADYAVITDLGAFHTFAVVRDPADRLNSMFYYLRSVRIAHPSATRLQCAGTFAEFCEQFVERSSPMGYPFLRSQIDFTRLGGNPVAVDSLLRFERLQEDYRALRQRLDLPDAPLPRLNVGTSRAFVTRADRRLVERLLSDEYEVFGY